MGKLTFEIGSDLYADSDVMKLLGAQCYNVILSDEDVKNIRDICKANEKYRSEELMKMLDIFVYGYLQGKRAERARKKNGKKWLF